VFTGFFVVKKAARWRKGGELISKNHFLAQIVK